MTTLDNTVHEEPAAPVTSTAKFWDRIAKRYAKRPVADEDTYQRKLRLTQEYLTPDMQVLEFGCGTGSTALIHASHVKHILAIDISPKMLGIAQGKADVDKITNVTFRCASIDDFSAPDANFDAIMGHSILHLLEDRDAAIAKAHAMLKPGGIFVSSTVCIAEKMKFLKLIAPVGRFLGLLPILKVFTIKELTENVVKRGFEIEQQWPAPDGLTAFIIAKKPV